MSKALLYLAAADATVEEAATNQKEPSVEKAEEALNLDQAEEASIQNKAKEALIDDNISGQNKAGDTSADETRNNNSAEDAINKTNNNQVGPAIFRHCWVEVKNRMILGQFSLWIVICWLTV